MNLKNNGVRSIFLSLLSIFSLHSFAEEIVDISAAQIVQADKQDWLIIDVRTPQEFAAGHVPNAINIPHTVMEDNIEQLQGYKHSAILPFRLPRSKSR